MVPLMYEGKLLLLLLLRLLLVPQLVPISGVSSEGTMPVWMVRDDVRIVNTWR